MAARFPRFIAECLGDFAKRIGKRFREELEVVVYWGPSRVGKSRRARWEAESQGIDPYALQANPGHPLWWYDYHVHEYVIIDDIGPGWFDPRATILNVETLLQLLDPYPRVIPTKGHHTYLCCKRIVITSNCEPTDWFRKCGITPEHLRAVYNRFTIVEKMTEIWTPPEYMNGVVGWYCFRAFTLLPVL